MPITEDEALEVYRNAPRLTSPDSRRLAMDVLSRYEQQQREAGEPLWPGEARRKADRTRRMRQFFQDRESHGFDRDQFKEFQASLRFQPNPEEARYAALNREFIGSLMGKPARELNGSYYSARNEYAKKRFGIEGEISERQFFDLVGQEFDTEDAVGDAAQRAGFMGVAASRSFANVLAENQIPENQREDFRRMHEEIVRSTSARLDPYRDLVRSTIADLRATTGAQEDRGEGEAKSYAEFAQQMLEVPERDRGFVLSAIATAGAGQNEGGSMATAEGWKNTYRKLSENFNRGVEDLQRGFRQNLSRQSLMVAESAIEGGVEIPVGEDPVNWVLSQYATAAADTGGMAAGLSPVGDSRETRRLTEDEKAEALARIDSMLDANDLQGQLREIAENDIDPAEGEYLVSRGLYAASRSIPYTAAAFIPGGIVLNTAALTDQTYRDLRKQNPDMDRRTAQTLAGIAGPIQAGLEQIDPAILRGKLPGLNRFFNQVVGTGTSRAGRFATRLATATGMEMTQENLQDITPAVVQGIASALSEDVPEVDWNAQFESMLSAEYQAELLFAVLPLSLIGAGVGTYSDFKNAEAYFRDPDLIRSAGIASDRAEAISDTWNAGNRDEAQAMLRAEFKTLELDQKGIAQVRNETVAKLRQETEQAIEAQTMLEQAGILPALRRTREGWALSYQDGTKLDFATHSDAMDAVWQHAEKANLDVATSTRELISQVTSGLEVDRELTFQWRPDEMTGEQAVAEGIASPAAIEERGQVGDVLTGQDTQQQAQETEDVGAEYQQAAALAGAASADPDARRLTQRILGMNQNEFVDGVQKSTLTFFSGATDATVVEEKAEADVSWYLSQGKAAWLVAMLRDFERVTGDTLFTKGQADETLSVQQIREAYSAMAVSMFVAKGTKGQGAMQTKGWRKLMAELMRTRAGGIISAYANFFRAVYRRAAKIRKAMRDGTLNESLEMALARTLGISEQAQQDEETVAEAARMAGEMGLETDDNAPFSMIPGTEGEGFQRLAMPDGRVLEGPAGFSLIAYHGTPHKVDRFSLEKIGTGEGAQAYGWGLYFAESQEIARFYQRALGSLHGGEKWKWNTNSIRGDIDDFLRDVLDGSDGESQLRRQAAEEKEVFADDPDMQDRIELFDETIALLDRGVLEFQEPGSLYQVELDANEEDFLDWDKPLSEQSEKVREAMKSLAELGDMAANKAYSAMIGASDAYSDWRGDMLYDAFVRQARQEKGTLGKGIFKDGAQAAASSRLAFAGIKGIRYRDAMSRDGSDSGTYNYVIFDESLIRIIAENGTPIEDAGFSAIPAGPAGDFEQRIARMFDPFVRSPDLRRQIMLDVKRRAAQAARQWQVDAARVRTKKDLEEERKDREAQILDELLTGIDLAPLAAEDQADPRNHPFMEAILTRVEINRTKKDGTPVKVTRGVLKSPAQAKADNGGVLPAEYNDMPQGLPQWIFGGTESPDVVADNLNRAGLLADSDSTMMWEQIESILQTSAQISRAVDQTQAEVAAAEAQAREESQQWAEGAIAASEARTTDRENLRGAMRTLNAMRAVLPPEVRGRVGGYVTLAGMASPKTMWKELERRADQIDRELERFLKKEIDKQVKKLFERAKPPKGKAGEKPKGKAGADIHDLMATLKTAWLKWDANDAEAHAVSLETKLGTGELTAEQEAHAIMEAALVRQFGDWKNADAARRNGAFEEAKSVYEAGYQAYQIQVAREREVRQRIREALVAETGVGGSAAERDKRMLKDLKWKSGWKDTMLNLLPFEGVLRYVFGEGGESSRIADLERNASNQKADEVFEMENEVHDLFTRLAGGKLAGERLAWRLAQKSVPIGERTMSQMEMVQALLMWRQEDGQRHMIGPLDENGKPTGAWNYGEPFVAEIEDKLSDEAREVMSFLIDSYASEYDRINPLFRELNGINLPRNDKYSPLTVQPLQAQGQQTVDPVTGQIHAGVSTTPGSLRSRGGAIAEPDFRDALQTYIAHRKQMAHWLAYARFNRDARAIMGNRDLRNAVEAKAGKEAAGVVSTWLDGFAAGGHRDASNHLAITKLIGRLGGNAAAMALVGRIGTLVIQSTQLLAARAEMPMMAYLSRMVKLFTGQLGWGAAIESPYIQRRIKQGSPIVQILMEGLKSEKPTGIRYLARQIGQWIPGMDGLFTAGTYAIVYDHRLKQARQMGFQGQDAIAWATTEAERITDRVAQPTRMGARSVFENTTQNPFMRLVWAFASEGRKNLGLVVGAGLRKDGLDMARAGSFIMANAIMATVIRSIWRDIRDGEDDEVFDERHWDVRRIALSSLTDPLGGVPVLGDMVEQTIYSATGDYLPDGNLLSGVPRAVPALERLATGNVEEGEFLRDLEAVMMAAGTFNSNIAAAASLMHLVRDTADIADNAITD